jgi:hypothetical protein
MGRPLKFSATPGNIRPPGAPVYGQRTRQVLL